jgi:hypothetical protein
MTTTNNSTDLAPFGFTPTESDAYLCLLDLGPSSGPAVARHLHIARTNAYDALRGLVAKHAALEVGSEPMAFRAVETQALIARLAARQADQLEALENRLLDRGGAGTPDTLPIVSDREFREVALRIAAREAGLVRALADAPILSSLAPLWHKRSADGSPTDIWVVGEPPAHLPLPPAGAVTPDEVGRFFPPGLAAIVTPRAMMAVHRSAGALRGTWSSEPLAVGSMRAALMTILGPEPH